MVLAARLSGSGPLPSVRPTLFRTRMAQRETVSMTALDEAVESLLAVSFRSVDTL